MQPRSRINTILYDLYVHLRIIERHTDPAKHLSEEFSDLEINVNRVDYLYRLLDHYDLFPAIVPDLKNDVSAKELRKKGNEMFKSRKDEMAVEFYTQSVALAEEASEELALAYANRSAVLFEIGFYQECLEDINRAFENGYPENLKPKLLNRKEKANQLKPQQIHKPFFQCIPEIEENHKSPSIQCAADSIEIRHTPDQGRHVVATRDIVAGEVLAVEKPFSHMLTGQHYNHCHECLKLCYNLIPCKKCTHALYCSEKCQDEAKCYHDYECKVMSTIKRLEIDKLKVFSLRIALQVTLPIVKELKEPDGFYRSNRYDEIHELIANTSKRSVTDLLERSLASAVIFHLIKKHTDFFEDENEEWIFKQLILLHMQTGPCNFHEISELTENRDGIYEPIEIGAGAYSFLSMFNHRCSPNVLRTCHGVVIVVRAIESIKKGEQCYDNYGYHHALTRKRARQRDLKEQYFFDCTCDVCENDWPLYIALPRIRTDVRVPQDDLLKLQNGDVEAAKAILGEMLPKIKELEECKPNKDLAEMQEIIKQCFALLGNVRRTL